MAAPNGYPSWVYNSTQLSSLVITSAAAFAALPGPGTWTTTPYAGVSGIPTDPGLTDTDIRLQQILIENRMTNAVLTWGFNLSDDLPTLRADILANDSGLTT